ncbi:MAG TPA: alpha-amylase domain-containing protein [Fimbriimonas sp.]|nr:alpha-amylase domain-containing protein [Fimbriimonas sp.]
MSNPWNGKAVLQVFFWNCWNAQYPADWYTYIAKLTPRLATLGFDGIWTPPPSKDTDAINNMGYTPFDYYDIGQKNQCGATGTRFGTQDSFLRMIAVAHANGLEVYPDIVLDHCGSGSPDPESPYQDDQHRFSLIQPIGFAGEGTGRWQRNWLDFHPNPQHWNTVGEWPADDFGKDFCYQGRCTDSGAGDPNCAARRNARAWLTWLVRQTGVDGVRFDDVKGFPPEVVEDVLYNAMGDRRDYYCAGELVPDNGLADLDKWADATLNRAGTFDFSFREALVELVSSEGYFDVGHLPSTQQHNRFKTTPFVNDHDSYDGQVRPYLDPDNPRTPLAYALAVAVDGSPMFFYADLFHNVQPWSIGTAAEEIPTRPWAVNLLWCHQKLAFKSGDYFVRYQDSEQLLIIERGARAIVAINNDGDSWHDAWISTAFFPHTQLHDYSGSRPDDIWTNQDGWVQIAVPPLSYSVWGPAGVTGGFEPSARRTLQQFEMDDDLGDASAGSLGYGGRAVSETYRSAGAIWPAPGSQVNLEISADGPQTVDLQVSDGTNVVLQTSGSTVLSASFVAATEAYYVLKAKLNQADAPPARLYIKADYMGAATSTAF